MRSLKLFFDAREFEDTVFTYAAETPTMNRDIDFYDKKDIMRPFVIIEEL